MLPAIHCKSVYESKLPRMFCGINFTLADTVEADAVDSWNNLYDMLLEACYLFSLFVPFRWYHFNCLWKQTAGRGIKLYPYNW